MASRAWPLAFLILSLWLVRYVRSGEFGLYEDDFTFLPPPIQMTLPELARATPGIFLDFMQGTPFKLPLVYWLAHTGWSLGGLRALYALGFAILALNVTLFYLLMEDVRGKQLATFAGLAYVLYSADTTQAFLTHSFLLQPSITLLLLALLCFRSRWKPLSYVLMAGALLTYETTYLVFVAAPVLERVWDQRWRQSFVRHVVVCGLILAGVVLLRYTVGDSRSTGLALADIALVPISHMLVGPIVSLGTYFYRPIQALQSLRVDVLLGAGLGAAVLVWLMVKLKAAKDGSVRTLSTWVRFARSPKREWAGLPPDMKSVVQVGLAGVAMLLLAYPITFTVRPYAISGRDTRVHAAGVVGASVLVGSALTMAIGVAEAHGRRVWVASAVGICAGLLAGYGLVIQNDYATAWELQRGFWSELVPLIPDVGDGSAILVDPSGLKDTRQMGANYWNLPRVLHQMFAFPATWDAVPRVYRLTEGWQSRILADDGRVRLDAASTLAPPSSYQMVDPAKVILVGYQDGSPRRISDRFSGGEPTCPRSRRESRPILMAL
jgi:hypothetical protein